MELETRTGDRIFVAPNPGYRAVSTDVYRKAIGATAHPPRSVKGKTHPHANMLHLYRGWLRNMP